MKRLVLLLLAACLASPFLSGQACSSCAPVQFTDTKVNATLAYAPDFDQAPAFTGWGFLRVTVSPASGGTLPAALPAGAYAAWCGTGPRDGNYNGAYTATTTPWASATVWNQINYILNHKSGTTGDVQNAIWALLGTVTIATLNTGGRVNAVAMYNDAIALGGSYIPAPGEKVAVGLRAQYTGRQHLIVELIQCGSIGDRVWRDLNGDGIPDSSEPGLDGVAVQLLSSAGAVVATTVTGPSPVDYPWLAANSSGWYRFTGFCSGSYQVRVDPSQPALGGARSSTPSTLPVNFSNSAEQSADFGFTAGAPPLRLACPQNWTQAGFVYNSKLQISGGDAPYAVTFTGALPPGLSMDGAGNLTGTVPNPVTPGSYGFTALVSAGGSSSSISCSIVIPTQLALGCMSGDAQTGKPFNGSLPPAGGSGQYTVAVTTPDLFPPGLSVDRASGRVWGTPSASGAYNFTAAVDDRQGLSSGPKKASCTLNIAAPPPPLTVACLASKATKNLPYDSTVAVTGGVAPYRFTIVGTLPPGLAFDPATGRLSGTPSQEGSYPFTIQAQDSAGTVATAGCGLTVDRPFTLSCVTAAGYAGLAYASSVGVAGGSGAFSFTASGLPAGLTLQGAALAGTPSAPGSYSPIFRVTDTATGAWDTVSCRLDLYTPPSVACPAATGAPGLAYQSPLAASGGMGRYRFAAAGLPAGWTLDASTGLISALLPSAGVVNFTATVTDDALVATATAQSACSIRIAAPMAVSCPAVTGQAGVPYASTVSAAGGISPYTYSIASGALPAGLTLGPTGALTGTPSASGAFSLTFAATDSTGKPATAACALTIAPAAPVAACPAPAAQASVAYASSIQATGGVAPYTYSLSSGTLPAGLRLDAATGAISGIPTTPSTSSFTARVVDSRGTSAGTSTASCAILTSPAPLTLGCPDKTAQVGVEYSSALVAAGGAGPYTFSIVAGSLPAGLTLNAATGALIGVPTTQKTTSFTAKVVDSTGKIATLDCQIVVSAPSNSCGLSWGYWKNHDWPVDSLRLGDEIYNKAELTALLKLPVKGDASVELAHQLIAAKFNILNGTNQLTARIAIAAVDALLSAYPGKLPYRVAPSSGPGVLMTFAANALEYFNSDGDAQPGCVMRK